jgi:hypothetical protein
MASQTIKRIDSKKATIKDTHQHNWEVMKPFVHFSVKAMGVIGHALVAIVKNIPKPDSHKHDKPENDKIIKI